MSYTFKFIILSIAIIWSMCISVDSVVNLNFYKGSIYFIIMIIYTILFAETMINVTSEIYQIKEDRLNRLRKIHDYFDLGSLNDWKVWAEKQQAIWDEEEKNGLQ